MRFLRLTTPSNGKPKYVNMDLVSEIIETVDGRSSLFFAFSSEGEQAWVSVEETMDQVMSMIKALEAAAS